MTKIMLLTVLDVTMYDQKVSGDGWYCWSEGQNFNGIAAMIIIVLFNTV